MLEYRIVLGEGSTPEGASESLRIYVSDAVTQGWKPNGSAFVIPSTKELYNQPLIVLAQAMIKN
ncbi:hypothetical protein [Chromobacterium haemolyticum]|uniref:hypothetical protein n=1 Tax=Chromobacterium haemolyticum TaxID=394935 RepID=UPI00307E34B5